MSSKKVDAIALSINANLKRFGITPVMEYHIRQMVVLFLSSCDNFNEKDFIDKCYNGIQINT